MSSLTENPIGLRSRNTKPKTRRRMIESHEARIIMQEIQEIKELLGVGYVSIKDAAKIKGCSELTIRNHLNAGRIPFIRDGKKYLIKRSDLNPKS